MSEGADASRDESSQDQASRGRGRVLIFDDETSILLALEGYLESEGFEVDTAGTPQEASRLLEEHPYDVLVSDLDPGSGQPLEGMDFLRRVRRSRPALPVVILSGHGDGEMHRQAAEIGIRDFLVKPQPLGQVAEDLGQVVRGVRDTTGEEDRPQGDDR